jgi:hypothetical protein
MKMRFGVLFLLLALCVHTLVFGGGFGFDDLNQSSPDSGDGQGVIEYSLESELLESSPVEKLNPSELKDLLKTAPLSIAERTPPDRLSLDGMRAWNSLSLKMDDYFQSYETLSQFSRGQKIKTVFGVSIHSINPVGSRFGTFQDRALLRTIAVVKDYRKFLKTLRKSPPQGTEVIQAFRDQIEEVFAKTQSELETLEAQSSKNEAIPSSAEMLEARVSTYLNKRTAGPLKIESSENGWIGQEIRLIEPLPKIQVFPSLIHGVKKIRKKAWKTQGTRFKKSSKLFIRSVLRDSNGKKLGFIVSRSSASRASRYLIPAPDIRSDSPQNRIFRLKKSFKPLVGEPESDTQLRISESKIASTLFQEALDSLEEVTSKSKSHLGVQDLESWKTLAKALKKDNSIEIRNRAYLLYRTLREQRKTLLRSDFQILKGFFARLVQIELTLNPLIEHNRERQDIRFHLGTAQNLIAIAVGVLGEKYKFDRQTRTEVRNGATYTIRSTRIGNFYATGTNSPVKVAAKDFLMSGQYSLLEFTFEGNPTEGVEVELNFSGLNQASKDHPSVNDYGIFILNPKHRAYPELVEELSKLKTTEQSFDGLEGYYKLPIEETQVFQENKADPSFLLTSKIIPSSGEKFSASGSGTVFLKFDLDVASGSRTYVVYQEAAGLTWAPWVDYDEATIDLYARESSPKEAIDRDGFRIIIDGSGTMKNLFRKVIGDSSGGLTVEFSRLGMESFLSPSHPLKPVFVFGGRSKTAGAKGPLALSKLKDSSLRAEGHSQIFDAVEKLGDGVPDKPWTLLILSDFCGAHYFDPKHWATSTTLNSAQGQDLPPLLLQDSGGNYHINRNGDHSQGWGQLREIHLIGVQNLLPQSSRCEGVKWVERRAFRLNQHGISFQKPQGDATEVRRNFSKTLQNFLKPIKDTLDQFGN